MIWINILNKKKKQVFNYLQKLGHHNPVLRGLKPEWTSYISYLIYNFISYIMKQICMENTSLLVKVVWSSKFIYYNLVFPKLSRSSTSCASLLYLYYMPWMLMTNLLIAATLSLKGFSQQYILTSLMADTSSVITPTLLSVTSHCFCLK